MKAKIKVLAMAALVLGACSGDPPRNGRPVVRDGAIDGDRGDCLHSVGAPRDVGPKEAVLKSDAYRRCMAARGWFT